MWHENPEALVASRQIVEKTVEGHEASHQVEVVEGVLIIPQERLTEGGQNQEVTTVAPKRVSEIQERAEHSTAESDISASRSSLEFGRAYHRIACCTTARLSRLRMSLCLRSP